MSISIFPAEIETLSGPAFGHECAVRGLEAAHHYITARENHAEVARALRIRAVENALYQLFGKGKLHGTIHTCIGQEFSGAILGKYLRQGDFVTSNHRCHGHFIGATGNWQGLIDEIVGNEDGVCAGIGSSQHLAADNFISNGQQGGLVPVAAGVALDRVLHGGGNAVVSFIGEGTLGEGVVYETLNLDALWQLPHVIVCENNFYSQSTRQDRALAGSVSERAAAFGVTTVTADTWDLGGLDATLKDALERARTKRQPTFLTLTTYRLNPHSKGDDSRERSEVDWFRAHDPATLAVQHHPEFARCYATFEEEAASYIEQALKKPALQAARYFVDQLPTLPATVNFTPVATVPAGEQRVAQQLNGFYAGLLASDPSACFIGEDIDDPYGGAFKVAKGLSTAFAERVRTTPISEAAITGVGIGLAICGRRAFVEMMFGDFITYAFDQIINNASKVFHIYNQRLSCPVVVRTPMGGRRGYGPTHSQSLERFLVGIDNCLTLALNSLVAVTEQLRGLERLGCPTILLENKVDYTLRTFLPPAGMTVESDGADFPTLRIRPQHGIPSVTLVSYGGMARLTADHLIEIFERTDTVPELIVPTAIHPLNVAPIAQSVAVTGRLVMIEEGAAFGGVGAELLAQLSERAGARFASRRVCGKPVPIPSAPSLEAAALPSVDDVCAAVMELAGRIR